MPEKFFYTGLVLLFAGIVAAGVSEDFTNNLKAVLGGMVIIGFWMSLISFICRIWM